MHATVRSLLAAGSCISVVALAGCAPDAPTATASLGTDAVLLARAGYDVGFHRQYGTPVPLGDGRARTYVVLDTKAGQSPVEVGVALDERALSGLPSGGEENVYRLALPARGPAPYTFVELDWNPRGHEPVGVYTVPHFDFHFVTISDDEWNSIVPTDPLWAAKASNLPTGAYVPRPYIVPGPPAAVAVPKMGVHWLDPRSPELQNLLGNPTAYQPFTKTFIYGSWNGRFTFLEPMITRAYLLSQPDVVVPIPTPALYPLPGFFPSAYRVTYDAQAREYRIALTALVARP